MSSREFYKVYKNNDSKVTTEVLDNDIEFNANHFKLYDDFTTDHRISYPLSSFHGLTTPNDRRADPNDSGVDMENGNPRDDNSASNDSDLLENEVMVDTWSSMDSSNSPLTDSGPSASDDCTASTSSEPHRGPPDGASPQSPGARRIPVQDATTPKPSARQILPKDKPRPRDLALSLEPLEPRRPHFLDEDYQSPSKSNIECRIPKPHFLDHTHTPSPDEFDERSDITNPNFLEDDVDADENAQKKSGALPKKTSKPQEDRPHRTSYRSTIHYGLDAARSSERDKRASQLYRGTWPGERDIWTGHDSASVRSFSSNGSADSTRPSSKLENKIECVLSLISLLSLSPENNADLSGPLLEMSRSVESCIAMRQAGCIPLLVQLIHSKVARETRDRAAKALRNIIHTQTDDKAGRREARVWRLLEQVREYCYVLEDLIEAKKAGKGVIEDDATKHPSQSVAALMKLSFDEEHRHVVCQLGGLQALAFLVSSDQAAHGSRTDDNTCLTMRKYAGMTLTNLTFGDGNNKSLLCSFKDFMMALVEQLESPNDDMRQVTAAVLRNLSWRADTNSKQVLREVGAVSGLTRAAMTCQKEATLKSVLSALWNLTAHCSMNKVALCSVDGSLGFLVDMLSYDSPTKTLAIVENAGGIMRNVSSHIAIREDYRQILRERNCLSVLLQHLKSPSLTVVSNSCGTLWNLSARCPQDQQFLWDHGAVPMLRSLIHSKHKMIAMGSSAALKNLLNSKPGKTHIISLDTTARNMNLPALPTLGARKQKALEQELDQNLAETCDNIEPATSPSTTNRDEKNLFTATERQIAMNLERHRMTSSSPMMGTLPSQISLSHSPHLSSYLSCSNTLLKGAMAARTTNGGSANNVNRSDSKDSVTSAQSDTVFEKVMRTGKVPIPTPRNKDPTSEAFKAASKTNDGFIYPIQPPIPPPRTTTEMRTNYTESGYDVDQDSCDQPIDYSRKYSETKTESEPSLIEKPKESTKKFAKKESTFGDYQETDLDQPTDYSLRYAEHQSENGSDSEPPAPSIHEDTIKHFATEGTPYETPVNFSTATSMSDLRVIGKEKPKPTLKENPEVMTHSDEKDTCSIEDPPRPDNDKAISTPQRPEPAKREVFDTKFSSGMASPEKPINYCDEGTPGYFSRVSSLSSLGEPTEEDNLAKKNAMATIHTEQVEEHNMSSSVKDKEGSKAVTFASDPVAQLSEPMTPGRVSVRTSSPVPGRFVEDTPLMFSRSSSLGSLPDCGPDDQGSVVSEVSRLTSGCISPSEIPDSPTQSAPLSPRATSPPRAEPPDSPPEEERNTDVFTERTTRYVVEHTPAQLSGATSLSNLTIDDEPRQSFKIGAIEEEPVVSENAGLTSKRNNLRQSDETATRDEIAKGIQTPGDSCQVYFTEDTPAILSGAGSHGNLSALSIDSTPAPPTLRPPVHEPQDSSDSSNLSDGGDLLEQYIQKGIAKVVKNKGPPSDVSSVHHYSTRDDVYRSLPPYLRSSTETVRMCHDFHPNLSDSRSTSSERGSRPEDSPPPPLPPKTAHHAAPPRPPPMDDAQRPDGRKTETESRARKESITREKSKLPTASNLARNDSLSSLSLDSFGSTDREIFEETVKAGLSSVNPKSKLSLDTKVKAHSVERPTEISRHSRIHKSLDRNDKIVQQRPKTREPEFERNLAAGAYSIKSSSQMKMLEESLTLRRSPYSYHGDATNTLAHHSRYRGFNPRYYDDGPPSFPTRIDEPRRPLERSNSLSSLSNDSFGSTDKEVFERCVRIGMSRAHVKKRDDTKLRVRSDDRLEAHRSRRRRDAKPTQGALDKMVGDEYSKDRAILEEVIARGAGELKSGSKNIQAPPTDRAPEGERGKNAQSTPIGCETNDSALDTSSDLDTTQESVKSVNILEKPNELPTVDSGNTTFESEDLNIMEQSNECLAPRSGNTTIESFKDELNRSNESYADVLDGTLSDIESPPQNYEVATLTRKNKNNLEWTDIKFTEKPINLEDTLWKSTDTWNDNTCPDDITFPTISGSIHMISSIRSEVLDAGMTLPDLLEKSGVSISSSRPDLTNRLQDDHMEQSFNVHVIEDNVDCDRLLESVQEPSYKSLVEDGDHKFDSISIEQEAARLADQLKNTQLAMEHSATSLTSLDLDNIRPPSNLGSLLSLSASGQWEETPTSKKSQKTRKKSLPAQIMVKRALSNSMHQGSSEHLDRSPVSFIDNIKPPSEMENLDMESSIISVSSISSDIVELKEKTPIVFDLKQPIQDFPLCNNYVFQDLAAVNPPSLFDEMVESTIESEQTTAHQVYEDCISTLNVVTDIPSGSENCSPLPSDMSSVESTPKRQRDPAYLTAKEKRIVSKDRYQTYTITDIGTDNNEILTLDTEQFLTWTKSENDRSEECATTNSDITGNIPKKKLSAKQRRMEDRARYQTQTVEVHLLTHNTKTGSPDLEIESLKQRLAAKKTMKQKRMEDAERFRTRTISEDIPPSPTFVSKDANLENIETTTGYDSLSSNELNHQQILDDRRDDDVISRDSGHNEDDFELNSTQMQTYTKSFRNYLPVIESPASVDMCVVKNLKNMEMTESFTRNQNQNPSSSDFASFEGDSNSDDKIQSDSDTPVLRPKPKIIKPEIRRDESLDSNESVEKEEAPKPIRGRKKAAYVSPYRRTNSTPTTNKKPMTSNLVKPSLNQKTIAKANTSAKTQQVKTPASSKASSANTSPKRIPPTRAITKAQQRPVSIPLVAIKPLPLERQGTFTKEDSTVPPKELPMPDKSTVPPKELPIPDKKTTNVPRYSKATTPTKPVTTSPSRLPQFSRSKVRPTLRKTNSNENQTASKSATAKRSYEPGIKNSISNHSLQSNDSGKTITLGKSSRPGSTSSVNSAASKTRDVESRIATLWKKVEQNKKQPSKPDKRVWIEANKETPKLIRSSTFEGKPKQAQVSSAPKQKTTIGIRVSQIPSLKQKPMQNRTTSQSNVTKTSTTSRIFARKPVNQILP